MTIALIVDLVVSPGLGVVAWFGLPLLVVLAIWLLIERSVERRRRRRAPRTRRAGGR